jgi:ribose 5-phosphate isomerase A
MLMQQIEALKREAAEEAVKQIKSGMILGLGTGSTANYAIEKIGELWQAGELTDIVGIPTSIRTEQKAQSYGIPLGTLDEYPEIDLAIDGADEVDPRLDLIKGLGGALLREKMVEAASKYFIVVVDSSKIVPDLGRGLLPVAVDQFGWKSHARWLEQLGCMVAIRGGEARPYVADNGNYILDCYFIHGIPNPAELDVMLRSRPGVVEHGLFLNMANEVIVAGLDGLQVIKREV